MTPTPRKLVAALVGIAVLGGTFVAGAATGDATDDDVAPTAGVASTPVAAAGSPVPLDAEPTAEPTWPDTSPLQPIDEPAAVRGAQGGPVPTDDPGVIEPISSSGPAGGGGSTTTSTSTSAGDPGDRAAEDLALRSLGLLAELPGLPWFRFLDPCADGSDESCGTGTGGTILPFGGPTTAGPLQLGRSLYDMIAIVSLGEQCNIGARPDGTFGVILFSNNPADLVVSWSTAADPATVHDAGTFSTSEEERADWEAKVLSGGVPTPDAGGVVNCIELPRAMAPGVRHLVHVEGTDLFGFTDSGDYSFTPPAPRSTSLGRPPVRFVPLDQSHGRVVAALDDADDEQLWVAELVRNGPEATGEDCTSIENEVLGGSGRRSWRLFNESVGPLPMPDEGDDYPYERRYDTAVATDYWPGEGADSTLCAWITRPPARSFDKPIVRQRSTLDIAAPRWYRTRVVITEADLERPVAGGTLRARIDEGGFGSSAAVNVLPDDTPAGAAALSEPVVVSDSESQIHPDQATITVASEFGEVRTIVPTPNKLCPVAPPAGALCPTSYRSTYTVRVPGPRAGSGLCAGSFGGCDPPTTGTFLGELTVVVESYAGPSGPPAYGEGFDEWAATSGTFRAADAPEPPEYVQLDWNRTRAVSSPSSVGRRPGVTLILMTDRPATATAYSVGWEAMGRCGLAPQTSTDLSVSHAFRWNDACFGMEHYLEVVFTDASGRETRYGPGGEGHLAAVVQTDTYEVAELDFDVVVTPRSPSDFVDLDLHIDGIDVPIVARSLDRCVDDPKRRSGTIRNEGGYPIRVAEPLGIWLRGRVDRGAGCDERARIDLTGSVPLEEVLRRPVELRFEDDSVTVVVTVVVRGRWPITPTEP